MNYRDILAFLAINWMGWLALLIVIIYDLLQESF